MIATYIGKSECALIVEVEYRCVFARKRKCLISRVKYASWSNSELVGFAIVGYIEVIGKLNGLSYILTQL